MSTDNEQLLSDSQKSSSSSNEISKQLENNKKNEQKTSTLTGLPINQTDQILDALDQDLQATNNQNNQEVPLTYFGANIEGSNNINVLIDFPTIIYLQDISVSEQNDYKLYCALKKNALYIKFLAVLDFVSSLIWIFNGKTEFILGLIFPPVGYYGALRFRKLYVALYSSEKIEGKINQVKNDLKSILEEDNDVSFENKSSKTEREPKDLQKRAKFKIQQFQEDFGSDEENTSSEDEDQKKEKKNTESRKGFISIDYFEKQKNSVSFKKEMKNLTRVEINSSDYDDDFDFSDSGSGSGSGSGSESDQEETNTSLSNLRNKFSQMKENSDSESDSDAFSEDFFSSEKSSQEKPIKKLKIVKNNKNNVDDEDDEFSDF
ncbi:u3 small nucleolar ribonucleoprotein mpp10 [Anaeramoeba flamelloides]|uniref:U3 small nucleolar ribonucleoprotein mpp10 n=1 Tax=Anaeramoeba flamelloides TaxID=1746091 RepID=A0ABQ8YB22_9EUKA|nr:u3 small nucleolar ribonucleoprotein mpp10 [Anaeramoeba flamelloides]